MSESDDTQSAIDALVDDAMKATESDDVMAPANPTEPGEEWSDAEVDDLADQVEADIEVVRAERDSFLADSRRLAADFANYRKQSEKRVAESAAAQSAALVRDLLPVLDACDSALEQDADSEVGPIRTALLGELMKNGLELIGPEAGSVFDPEQHDAVQHEPMPVRDSVDHDGGSTGPAVAELLRAGYAWKGRVIRPAMVKVVG